MIEDKKVQAAAPEKIVTMADPGKAEPGRDIFAGEPVKEIKSDHLQGQPPAPVREQKEISSVVVGTLSSSSTSLSSDSKPSSSLSSSSLSSDSSIGADTSNSASGTPAQPQTTTEGAVKPQVAGPIGEAELEAQKVANELYPDAAKNDYEGEPIHFFF